LGLEHLCEDATKLDLEAFNQPNGGFVVARDAEHIGAVLRQAFATGSAAQWEEHLNQHGIPAARVRTPEEFLRQADSEDYVTLPFTHYGEGGTGSARTPGLGFAVAGDVTRKAGAPGLGADTRTILDALGRSDADIERLRQAGIVK